MMMPHYFAGDAPWVVASLLLAMLCLVFRRWGGAKPGGNNGSRSRPNACCSQKTLAQAGATEEDTITGAPVIGHGVAVAVRPNL
jgi:hypothetical protein